MKILLLCKKFPYPMKDGESIAIINLARELQAMGCEISLLSMNTRKHYAAATNIPPEDNCFKAIHTVDVDNSIQPWKAFTSILAGESYHISRFKSVVFQTKLIEILKIEKFDIVQLETLYLAPYVQTIRKYSKAHVVMRAHNVEHEIWERITSNTGSNLRKVYLTYLTRKLRQYEIGQFEVYDYLVTLTDRDLLQFRNQGYTNGAAAAPIGFDLKAYEYAKPSFHPNMSIGFIGSLDWMPNREGLEWFLKFVWPQVYKKWPKLTFHIAGRNPSPSLLELKMPNVIVHGEVEDASAFISDHPIMVVPLFSGSGMRVKVVEGMALGKFVITTSLGKEGIPADHKEHVWIADTAQAFIEGISYCLENPRIAEEMGIQARHMAAEQFDNHEAAVAMMEIYEGLVAGRIGHGAKTKVSVLS